MFVGAIIVEDDVDGFARGDVPFDLVKDVDELLMPMALHVLSDGLLPQLRDQRAA